MTLTFTESVVEDATLDWFADLGYTVAHGPNLAMLPRLLSGEIRMKDAKIIVAYLVAQTRTSLAPTVKLNWIRHGRQQS